MPAIARATAVAAVPLYLRSVRRVLRHAPLSPRAAFARPDDRMVFVFGSPRSGTTFLAGAIGSLPGFVDLGEVTRLKAAIPSLAGKESLEAARELRRMLVLVRRLGLVGERRAVEQTPETVFLARAISVAFPAATLVHLVRDGRDVVCSLLERGWLSGRRAGSADDAGLGYGRGARFWVERGREREFEEASDVRRAAWAWRRYVTAGRDAGGLVHEVRYEQLVADPDAVAETLAALLGARAAPLAARLRRAHPSSLGRFRRELDGEQLGEVTAEAGELLRELGYA